MEKKVAIVTDSTSDLPADLCEEMGIAVVPLTVTIDGDSMPDRTLTMQEFFDRMNAAPQLPTTSQPAVGSFVEAFERALETAPEVVCINISEKLSGTYASAKAAAEQFQDRVTVFDTMQLSWSLGFQVLEGARAAAEGLDSAAVIERVKSVRDRVHLLVGLDGMENLVKGGRLSRFSGAIGGFLNVKVTITTVDGEIVMDNKVRGAKAHREYGMEWLEGLVGESRRGAFCVMNALSEDTAQWFKAEIEKRFEPTALYMAETGTVIATHTGSGWGLAFVPEE